MRITCPSCTATYEVPDALLDQGARKVRCARCAFEWQPEPLAPAPPPLEPAPRLRPAERPLRTDPLPPLPPPERMPSSARARSGSASMLASLAALAISVVVLISLGWAVYAWRAEVMHAWPPSQRLFAALGLA
jgi:predicted Zn finger-like uncharacterized protein